MRPEVHAASAIAKPISRLHYRPQPQAPQGPPSRGQFPPNGHRLAIGGNGNSAAAAPSENGAGWPPGNAQQQQQQTGTVSNLRGKSERVSSSQSPSQQPGNGKHPHNAMHKSQQNGQARQHAPSNGKGALLPRQQNALIPLPAVLRHPMGPKRQFQRETPLKPGGTAVQDTYSMWDFYCDNWLPFGELLTDMEREGFLVNRWDDYKS